MAKKTKDYPHSKEPRKIEDIQKEYAELCGRAGQAQYQISVINKELENLNEQLQSVNQEAAARNQLDQQAKAKEQANGNV